jgi:hypothetical protein
MHFWASEPPTKNIYNNSIEVANFRSMLVVLLIDGWE